MSIGIVTASATEAANPALTNLIEMLGSFCPGLLCIFIVYSRRPPEILSESERTHGRSRKVSKSKWFSLLVAILQGHKLVVTELEVKFVSFATGKARKNLEIADLRIVNKR